MVNKMSLFLLFVIILILASCNSEHTLNNRPDKLEKDLKYYPYFFFEENQTFNAFIIIDDFASQEDESNAKDLLEYFKQYDKTLTDSVIKKYPSEYSDLGEKNIILIGSCTQEPHNKFINIFVDCLSMREDQSIIRIIDNRGVWVLNVMGYSPVETANAIEALKNYENFEFKDYHVEAVRINKELVVRGPQ